MSTRMSNDLLTDLYRQQLLWTAAHYDLAVKKERIRSVMELENYFIRLCNVVQPEIFIEAGAHDGKLSGRMRRYLKTAHILAFEANPENYSAHKDAKHIQGLNIEYINKALSDKAGTLDFNILEDGRGHADKQGSLISRAEDTSSRSVSVEAVRMDEYVTPGSGSVGIWIDVEGASGQVLRGMEKLLPDVSVMFIEVEDRHYWENQWLARDVTSFLLEHGLRPIARDYQSRYQHNMIFVSEATLRKDIVQHVMSERASLVGQKVTKL